jgi:hypothetical protein
MDDERTIALRPVQLFGFGVLAYGLLKHSLPAGLAGLGVLLYDARRESTRPPDFSPLDLVTHKTGVPSA